MGGPAGDGPGGAAGAKNGASAANAGGGDAVPGSPSSRFGRDRQPSRGPPSAYRIWSSALLPGGPYRFRATSATLRCPTTSRPRRIQPDRRSSSRSPLASSTVAARVRPSPSGSSTSSSVPARRASAASRPSRSPTRACATAGSRPSGRSSTSRSTVRAASSDPASDSASARSAGVSTTSHCGRTPRATASTGSNARARSSQATMDPAACASAATRSASVVFPDVASPRSATVAERGSPPVPRMASSAANPVETTRPSWSGAGTAGQRDGDGADSTEAGPIDRRTSAASVSSASGASAGAIASAPWTCGAASPQRRGAAAPQRAWRVARAWETSDVGAIGRPIIERLFYSSRVPGRFAKPGGAQGWWPPERWPPETWPPETGPSRATLPGRSTRFDRVWLPWGCSSAGRAPRSHRGGQGFESPHLHHRGSVGQVVSPRVCKTLVNDCGSSILPRPTSFSRARMGPFGASFHVMRAGRLPPRCPGPSSRRGRRHRARAPRPGDGASRSRRRRWRPGSGDGTGSHRAG